MYICKGQPQNEDTHDLLSNFTYMNKLLVPYQGMNVSYSYQAYWLSSFKEQKK